MSESITGVKKEGGILNTLNSKLKWSDPILQTMLMVILVSILAYCLFSINSSADHTDVEVTTSFDGIAKVNPGSAYYLEYELENTGAVNERYKITMDSQYSWKTELQSIENQNGDPINYTDHENEYHTNDELLPGQRYNIKISVQTPVFGISHEYYEIDYLERSGLLAGSQTRISLIARTFSDNYATGDEAQYILEVKLINEVLTITEKEIIIDTWGSREYAFDVNITHLSNSPHESSGEGQISINITPPDQDWIIECSDNIFSLLPRISKTISVHVVLPDDLFTLPDPYYETIVFTGQNSLSTTIRTSSVRVWLKQIGSVDVLPATTSDIIVIPGQTSLINFTVKNTGNAPDSFTLHITGESMPWLILPTDSTQTIRPEESIIITVPINIPLDDIPLEGERRKITFSARSVESPDYLDSAESHIIIGPFHWVEFHEDMEIEIFPPSNGKVELTIVNRGNIRESVIIAVDDIVRLNGVDISLSESNWGITLGTSVISLEPGLDENILVEVTAGGDYNSIDVINFTVNALLGGNVNTSTTISVTVGDTHGVRITTNFTVLNGKLGETVDHIFMITNTGTTTDVYDLSVTLSRQWQYKLNIRQITLKPHTSSIVRVSMTIPIDSPEGASCDLNFSVSNIFTSGSITVTTITSRTRIMDISLVNITYHAYPEATKEVALNVANSGNVQDTYIIDAFTSTNWQVDVIPGSVTIKPFSSLETTIRLTAPSLTSTYDTITILVKAYSDSDETITSTAYLNAKISMVKAVVTEDDPYLFYDDPDQTGLLKGYATRGSSIEYDFMIRNIDAVEQHITIEHSSSKLPVSIAPSALLVDPGKEGTFTVTVTIPDTAMVGKAENLVYISTSGGKHETIRLISHVITKDLRIHGISLNRVMEGKTTDVKVQISYTGNGFSDIGNTDLLTCRNIVLLLEYKDEAIIRTISFLDIGSSTTVRFRVSMDLLKWYQKEKDVTISVRIIGYKSIVEGDDNPNNNKIEKRMDVHDSPPSGLLTTSSLIGFFISLFLLGITAHYYRSSMSTIEGSESRYWSIQEHYLRALCSGLILGMIFTFPVDNLTGEIIISIGIILGFALTVNSGLGSAKRRVGIGVPLLYFIPMICIITIGTGLSMMIESIVTLTTPFRMYQLIIGVLCGVALNMKDQYTNINFQEFPSQIIWPVFSMVIAGFLASLFILIGGVPGTLFILIFIFISLGFMINSLPLLRKVSLGPILHLISFIMGLIIFITFILGYELTLLRFLIEATHISNGLIILLFIGCGLLSYQIGYNFRVTTGYRIENLLAVMINISEGRKIFDNPFEEFNYYHVSELFREGHDLEP